MMLIQFTDAPRDAFLKGFMKGFCAPAVLFNTEAATPPHVPLVVVPEKSTQAVLAGDWLKIGSDFGLIVEQHGKATTAR